MRSHDTRTRAPATCLIFSYFDDRIPFTHQLFHSHDLTSSIPSNLSLLHHPSTPSPAVSSALQLISLSKSATSTTQQISTIQSPSQSQIPTKPITNNRHPPTQPWLPLKKRTKHTSNATTANAVSQPASPALTTVARWSKCAPSGRTWGSEGSEIDRAVGRRPLTGWSTDDRISIAEVVDYTWGETREGKRLVIPDGSNL